MKKSRPTTSHNLKFNSQIIRKKFNIKKIILKKNKKTHIVRIFQKITKNKNNLKKNLRHLFLLNQPSLKKRRHF
jgi:hypothetical protein